MPTNVEAWLMRVEWYVRHGCGVKGMREVHNQAMRIIYLVMEGNDASGKQETDDG